MQSGWAKKNKTHAVGFPVELIQYFIFKSLFKLVVICLLCLSFYTCCQRLTVWLVADSEALTCQATTTFDTSCDAWISTTPAINYTVCWQLVFILYLI